MYYIADKLGYVNIKPRSNSPLGLFGPYDGNILGGGLLGAGMALAGACPGTMLAQTGAGVRSGFYSLGGAVLGGIIWTGFLEKLVSKRKQNIDDKVSQSTVGDLIGLSRPATLALLEVTFVSIIIGTTLLAPVAPEPKILGAVGGLFIGSAQLFSILTRRDMLGVSASYEEAGSLFWWIVSGFDTNYKPNSPKRILFGAGLVAGAWTLSQAVPDLVSGAVAEVSPQFAVLGAVLMVVGARTAGGCTSGHGISGISLLSTSSMITIASTFGVGALVASLIS